MDAKVLKCPACCAPLSIDNATGGAVCEFCGTSFSREELFPMEIAVDPIKGGVAAASSNLMPVEQQAIDSLPCECPEHADMVIPFRVTKEQAIQGFKEYYAGSKLLPKAFVKALENQEIEQVFYPVWVFDARVEGAQDFDCQDNRIWKEYETLRKVSRSFKSSRSGSLRMEVRVLGTDNVKEEMEKDIELYCLDDVQPFSQDIIKDANIELFTLNHDQALFRAGEIGEKALIAKFGETLSQFCRVECKPLDAEVYEERSCSVLFPAWRVNFEYFGKHSLYMNGQNGVITGNVPFDKKKLYLPSVGVFAGIFLVGFTTAFAFFG